ncbi:uncharacterized protein meiosin [Garra rufa]|uniref:uncharacterized protein meiosin n=1 Tax=Garra rufa TaxID=137080 RepID=UPI003CCEC9AA
MLQCFDFHRVKSHPHRLSENNEKKSESESEDTPLSCTPPQFLKAKNIYTYSRINKYTVYLLYTTVYLHLQTVQLSDKKRDPQSKTFERFIINAVEEQEHQITCAGQSSLSEVQTVEDKDLWPVDDSEPSQSSLDSYSTTSSFNTGSTEAESSCSFCEDQTGSEDGSPGGNMLNTPPSSSRVLLKDPMLGSFPAAWKKRFLFSPTLSKTPVLPLRPPLREADSLTLNPSLLISPSQGLSRSLHPEGQEALQTLFEDVWVTQESTVLKTPSLPGSFANDSVGQIFGSNLSFKSGEENQSSEDETPKQLVPLKRARKGCSHRHTSKRGRVSKQPNPKKKCVNGFIMFCRINRKLYIRSYPGVPSTTVTKELAKLWHILPKRERRLYCLKAWSFSCQQNRNVRFQVHETERKAGRSVPSPLHMLLAYRDKYAAVK